MAGGYDPFDLVGQEEDEQRRKDEAELKAMNAESDFKWLMSHAKGRRIVWSLLEKAHVFQSSYTGDNTTFFREGERNIGLFLMAQINEFCPDLYVQMVLEQNENDRNNDDPDN
jgi:hypothetical protein